MRFSVFIGQQLLPDEKSVQFILEIRESLPLITF